MTVASDDNKAAGDMAGWPQGTCEGSEHRDSDAGTH